MSGGEFLEITSHSDFRAGVVRFGNPATFAFVNRIALETSYRDSISAAGNVAPYLVFGIMGAARLPMVRRIENPGVLHSVEITARIADACSAAIDRARRCHWH